MKNKRFFISIVGAVALAVTLFAAGAVSIVNAMQANAERDARMAQPTQASSAGEVEFNGMVEAIGTDTWTIGGRVVSVTAGTELKGALSVGDLVKVHALPGSNGTLAAREIEPARAGVDGNNSSPDDDGTPDQGKNDDGDDSARSGDDDGTPDQGRQSDDDPDDDDSGHGSDDDSSHDSGDDHSGKGGG